MPRPKGLQLNNYSEFPAKSKKGGKGRGAGGGGGRGREAGIRLLSIRAGT